MAFPANDNRRAQTPLGLNKAQKLRQNPPNLLSSSINFINLLQQWNVFNGTDPAT